MDGDKPTRESLREVKREARARRKAEKQRSKATQQYWDQQSGRAARRSSGGGIAAVLGLVVLVGLAGAAFLMLRGGLPGLTPSSDVGASASGSPTASASPVATGSTGPDVEVVVVEPFADSPARTWPVGAAGISAPAAAQVGVYRKAQVKDAYAKVRTYLKAAVLDPRVTYQGKLDPVWATLPAETRAYLKTQRALWDTSKGEKGITWDSLANRFYPKDWKGAAEVRVRSRLKPSVSSNGALRVHFVVVAAYWMQPRAGGTGRTIVVRRVGDVDFYGRGTASAGPMYYGGSGYTSTASVCGSDFPHPDYLEAWVDEQAAPVVSPSAPTQTFDVGDPDAAEPDGCFTDTSGF